MSARRPRQATPMTRKKFEEEKRKMELIQKRNERIIQETKEKIRKNNEKIRQLLRRAFTSKREERDLSPVVRQQLEKLEKVLSKHEDRNQQVLKQIALALDDAVLLTTEDIKAAQESERDDTFFRRLTKSISRHVTKRRSPGSMRGGRKTRKNRGKKQRTQKRKQSNKKRKHTQRRKQHKKK